MDENKLPRRKQRGSSPKERRKRRGINPEKVNKVYIKKMSKNAEARLKAEQEEQLLLGNKIKSIRITYNLTQKEFAEMIGVSHAHISKIENQKDSPSNSLLMLIINKFNINEDWLNNNLNELDNFNSDFMFNNLSVFVSNLKHLQDKFGLSKREMNIFSNTSTCHLDNIECLKLHGLNKHVIDDVCKYFKLSAYDVINTKMNTLEENDSTNYKSELSENEKSLLDIYNSCTNEEKKTIMEIMNNFR